VTKEDPKSAQQKKNELEFYQKNARAKKNFNEKFNVANFKSCLVILYRVLSNKFSNVPKLGKGWVKRITAF